MNFNYEIELTCGHTQVLSFPTRMSFNEDTEIRCLECEESDFHLIQDYICLNDFSSFTLLMNRKSM